MPSPDYVIKGDEHLMAIGKKVDVDRILKALN